MVVWAIVIGYLVIGAFLARSAFTRTLGDADRTYEGYALTHWTFQFTSAFWVAIGTFFAWPIVFPFIFIMAETPHERLLKQKQEEKELAQRFKELEREVYQFGSKL